MNIGGKKWTSETFVLNSPLRLVNISEDFSAVTSDKNLKNYIFLIFVMCKLFMGCKTLWVTKRR